MEYAIRQFYSTRLATKNNILKKEYDVIIIGAGISGLTNAALLSKAGLSCCVLEKEPVIGGYLQGFRRKDFVFDSAIHWLNQCGDEGMVTKIFKIIGTDYPKTISMPNIHRFKSDNIDYLLTNKPDTLKEQLIKDYPHEKKGIEKLFRVAKRLGKSSRNFKNMIRTTESMSLTAKITHGLKVFKTIIPMLPFVMYSGDKSITRGLNKHFFKDKKLHKLYSSEKDLLSCIFPIAWAYINDYQMPIKGGGQVYTEWLKYVIEYFDNDIILKAKVKEITFENKTTTGAIFTKNGEEHSINAKYVIAACDVDYLYLKMLPKSVVSEEFLSKLDDADLYYSGVAISIAIDCPAKELGINDELVSITRDDIGRNEHESGDPLKSAISVISPSERDKTLAPKGKGEISIYIPASIEYNNYWQTDGFENGEYIRGSKYKEHKQEFANILINRVEKILKIDIRSHILFFDVSTPITYYRYTGNRKGSIMGARPGKKNMQLGVSHYKTPIKNLFLSGHWAELGGGVPIAVQSAINSSLLVLQNEDKAIFNLLAKYTDGKTSINDVNNSNLLKKYNNSWVKSLTPSEKKEL